MTSKSVHNPSTGEPIGDAKDRKKILVVDNHPMTLNMIANLIKKQGHKVLTAGDGLAALDILKWWVPDVVFMDLVMPNIGGEKLCRIIRKSPHLSDVFIVIVSAVAAEEASNVTTFGADACIAKCSFGSMGKHILNVLETFDRMPADQLAGTILGLENVYAREITRELLSVKGHFEIILSRMDEGILEITDNDRVVFANPAALAIIGKAEEEILASNFIDLFDGNDRERIGKLLERPVTDPRRLTEDEDVKLCGKDITIDFFPIKDSEKKIIAMIKDVSERKQMKAQILKAMEQAKQMAVEAEAANVAKSAFLAIMSHEIRIPMNAVIGFTDMLFNTELSEDQLEYAATIKQGGELLLTLINDILDFSKIEAGQLDLESIDFDPKAIARHICDLIRPQVRGKPIEILCRIERDVPGSVKGDPARFRQVLVNLMGNAAKFTESGEIELMLGLDKAEGDCIKLHAAVRDTGEAIPAEKLDLIFEVFEQGDTSTTRRYGGTGLGLSICRRIAALMNGKVWAESEPGKGNVFHFTAWLDKSETPKTRKRVATTRRKSLTQGTLHEEIQPAVWILLAEDNMMSQKLATLMLKKAGYRVVVTGTGREVIDEFLSAPDKFSLVFMDIQMPEIDGLEATRTIREWEKGQALKHPGQTSRIPIVALTANAMKGDRERCLEAGMDDYAAKPIEREVVFAMLEKWVKKSEESPIAQG